jgi:hypothetical protein
MIKMEEKFTCKWYRFIFIQFWIFFSFEFIQKQKSFTYQTELRNKSFSKLK